MSDEVRFTDDDGVTWTVYEVPATIMTFDDRVVDESRAHLCFEADVEPGVCRKKLSRYPAGWRDLPQEDLAELCADAGPTQTARAVDSDQVRRRIVELET